MRALLVGIVAVLAFSGAGMAQTADDFKVENTADFVDLCSADPNHPLYVAAIHFCHGFGSGAYHYYEAEAVARPDAKFVCFPTPGPTRSQVIDNFVAWVKARPQYLTSPAVDTIFRYLGETYPCRK